VGSPNEASTNNRLLKGSEQAEHEEGEANGERNTARRTFPAEEAEITSCWMW